MRKTNVPIAIGLILFGLQGSEVQVSIGEIAKSVLIYLGIGRHAQAVAGIGSLVAGHRTGQRRGHHWRRSLLLVAGQRRKRNHFGLIHKLDPVRDLLVRLSARRNVGKD